MSTVLAVIICLLLFIVPILLAVFDFHLILCALLCVAALAILFFYHPKGSQ